MNKTVVPGLKLNLHWGKLRENGRISYATNRQEIRTFKKHYALLQLQNAPESIKSFGGMPSFMLPDPDYNVQSLITFNISVHAVSAGTYTESDKALHAVRVWLHETRHAPTAWPPRSPTKCPGYWQLLDMPLYMLQSQVMLTVIIVIGRELDCIRLPVTTSQQLVMNTNNRSASKKRLKDY